jgi:hypothetical protein
MTRVVAFLIGLIMLGTYGTGWAEPSSRRHGPEEAVYGAGSVIGTLVYAPVKASFCILGLISSGFAFPIAGPRTAGKIAGSTCEGTWVITPDNLRGTEPVRFVGP